MKVLVVEDERSTRNAIRHSLALQGHEVNTAGDPRAAAKAADTLKPDVVVCDWQLGDEDRNGVDVASDLQRKYSSRIIMITGQEIAELKKQVGNLIVDFYFRKPLSLSRLMQAVSSLR